MTDRRAPAKQAADEDGTAEQIEDESGETPYSFADEQVSRHKMLLWAVPGTFAIAAVGSYFGYIAVPGLSANHPSVVDNLEAGAMVLAGLATIVGVIVCFAAAWPSPLYGPETEPKPMPLWLAILRIIGCWLAMLPFSGICLLLVGGGVDAAVNGDWTKAIIVIVIGLIFGAGACILLAGSGALRGEEIKTGGQLPEAVRKSTWWRRFKVMLTLWALFITGVAIFYGVKGQWGDFWETMAAAFGSWVARLIAATDAMPEETFKV